MKIPRTNQENNVRRRGSATLLVLGLISIMAILVAAELTAVRILNLDLRLIEQRQLKRLQPGQPKPAPVPAVAGGQTHG